MERPPVAVLVGPTAVGKSALALKWAQELGGEIVNADSLQVYREMDLGTAKPTPTERALVPHHLLDVVSPDEPYDAARYGRDGRAVLARLHQRGVPPLVVGGTGFYIKALLKGLFAEEAEPAARRARLRRELAALGLPALYARLGELDPATAQRLHPHDTYRVLRALEVAEAGGPPLSALQEAHGFKDAPYRVLTLGLTLPREELNERIDRRVEAMLAQGWLKEVEGLLSRYPPDLKPFKSLGYRHLIAYLEGRWGWEEAVARLKSDTRHYAKRQLTWFRADPAVCWTAPGEAAALFPRLREFFG